MVEDATREDFWGQLPRADTGGDNLEAQLGANFRHFVSSLAHAVGVTTKRDPESNFARLPHAALNKCAMKVFRAVAFEALVAQTPRNSPKYEHLKVLKDVYDNAWSAADVAVQSALSWKRTDEKVDETGMPPSVKDLRSRARSYAEQQERLRDVPGLLARYESLTEEIKAAKALEGDCKSALDKAEADLARQKAAITAELAAKDADNTKLTTMVNSLATLREEVVSRKAKWEQRGDHLKQKMDEKMAVYAKLQDCGYDHCDEEGYEEMEQHADARKNENDEDEDNKEISVSDEGGPSADHPTKKQKLSGFMAFSQEHREKVKAENPGITFGQIGKRLGEMWRALSGEEKDSYK